MSIEPRELESQPGESEGEVFDRIHKNLDVIEEGVEKLKEDGDKSEPTDAKIGDPLGAGFIIGGLPDRHKVIYIGSPYTHAVAQVQEDRWKQISQIVAFLIEDGHWPYSPIAHGHSIATFGELEGHFDFWQDFDREMIRRTDEFWIACMEGWHDSKGLKAELEFAKSLAKQIRYVIPIYEYADSRDILEVRLQDDMPEPWASMPNVR